MTWWVKYGHKEEWFKKLEQEGKTTKAISSKPELFQDLYFIQESFLMLSCSRSVSQLEPIKYTEILAYFEICSVSQYERIELTRWIKLLDNKFLELRGEQLKIQNKRIATAKPKRR